MTAAWIAFILYAATAIILGWRSYRRGGTPADFWTAGRNLDSFYLSSGELTTAVTFPVAAVFLPGVNPRGVQWSSAAGLGRIILAYFLEVHGSQAAWEPAWLADSGLGFILWGILAAGVGYGLGSLYKAVKKP